MQEYETLIESLIGMAKVTRPLASATGRQDLIQHGICDIMEDAAVAIDDLLTRMKGFVNEERTCREAA